MLAEFGIILLLFSGGIEISFRDLGNQGEVVVLGDIGQIVATGVIAYPIGLALGWVHDHKLDEIMPGNYAYKLFASHHRNPTDALLKHQVCHFSNRCVFLNGNYGVTHDLPYPFTAHISGNLFQGFRVDPGTHKGIQVVGHWQKLAVKAKVSMSQNAHQLPLVV